MSDNRYTSWTQQKTDILRDLWDRGFSASRIAAAVGMSRNAVLGRKWRLGLENRKSVVVARTQRVPRKKAVVLLFKQPIQPMKLVEPTSKHIQLTDLGEHHCRFPLADGTYCGNDKELRFIANGNPVYRSSYCSYHHAKCHQPPRR